MLCSHTQHLWSMLLQKHPSRCVLCNFTRCEDGTCSSQEVFRLHDTNYFWWGVRKRNEVETRLGRGHCTCLPSIGQSLSACYNMAEHTISARGYCWQVSCHLSMVGNKTVENMFKGHDPWIIIFWQICQKPYLPETATEARKKGLFSHLQNIYIFHNNLFFCKQVGPKIMNNHCLYYVH